MSSVANAHRKKVFTTDRWTAGNAGLQLERPRAAPVGQQPGVDTLKQDDLSGVGIVPLSGEHPSRLRGVFDTSLSHVAQVQIDRRLDGDVVGLLYRFHGDTFQFEGFLQLAVPPWQTPQPETVLLRSGSGAALATNVCPAWRVLNFGIRQRRKVSGPRKPRVSF